LGVVGGRVKIENEADDFFAAETGLRAESKDNLLLRGLRLID
jgi:hypothetical protein